MPRLVLSYCWPKTGLWMLLSGCLLFPPSAKIGAEEKTPAATPVPAPKATEKSKTDSKTDPKPITAKPQDDLFIFQDIPQVVSASRQERPVTQSSVPISVLTAEDIHYGGRTNLPEVLQFVPGMDELRIDRNRYAVGVRGFHDYFSDRTLMMINGRNAESPIFGGPEFLRYPLMMEDIERIEVVRGPGGAAWGANAFNGVINVITKKPEDMLGFFGTTTIDEFGDTYSQVRYAGQKGKWSFKTTFGYDEYKSSESAISGDDFTSRDFARAGNFDGEARYKMTKDTLISFGTGYQYQQQGAFEFLGYKPTQDGDLQTVRSFAKVEQTFNKDLSGYLQWFGNFSENNQRPLQRASSAQNDIEAQVNYKIAPKHSLTTGANFRLMNIDTDTRYPEDLQLFGAPFTEYQAGAFALYRFEATRQLSLEAQARVDWYSGTQTDWSSRLAILYAVDKAHKHTLRFSAAKAFRAPQVGLRDFEQQRGPFSTFANGFSQYYPFPTISSQGIPNDNVKNEEMGSYEVGYAGRLTKKLTLNVDGYIQRYQNLLGFTGPAFFTPTGLGVTAQAHNLQGANAYGVETELAYTNKYGKISAWFAYNALDTDLSDQIIRAFHPAKFKAGFTGRAYLPHQVTLNLNYRYADQTDGDPNNRNFTVDATNMLDFTVSKKLYKNHFEIMAGVTDILNTTDSPVRAMGSFGQHETPGRTFFGRFQLKF